MSSLLLDGMTAFRSGSVIMRHEPRQSLTRIKRSMTGFARREKAD